MSLYHNSWEDEKAPANKAKTEPPMMRQKNQEKCHQRKVLQE